MVAELSRRFYDIAMVGLSGGGWTTTVYSAIDTRISKSYPVAGSLPFSLRYQGRVGDWEQTDPGLYSIAGYLDLYVLGASGPARSQLQVLNTRDPCCFAGTGSSIYEDAVQQRVRALGPGRFAVRTYTEPDQHAITDEVLRVIGDDLG
jgi:hypothetical protein